jgi:RNA polymerase sigma factor (sigma-70 family)
MRVNTLFNEIYRRHHGLIKGIIRKFFPDSDEANDVFQDVSIHILEKLGNATSEEITKWESGAWINTVCTNKCRDILKGKKKNNSVSIDGTNNSGLNLQIADKEKDDNLILFKTTFRNFISTLKSDEQKIIILRFINGYSVKKIGEIMELSNPSVYLTRAIEKLKKYFDGTEFIKNFDSLIFSDVHEGEDGFFMEDEL